MRINNAGEFAAFVKSHQLMGMASEAAGVVICIDEYGRMCACDSIQAHTAKQNQCRAIYLAFAAKSNQYKAVLLSKTNDPIFSICIDNQPIVTLNR